MSLVKGRNELVAESDSRKGLVVLSHRFSVVPKSPFSAMLSACVFLCLGVVLFVCLLFLFVFICLFHEIQFSSPYLYHCFVGS